MVAMLGSNLLDAGIRPSSADFPIDSAMPLTQIVMP
jgi:N6-L-threonylcarbamoyladenine synthase